MIISNILTAVERDDPSAETEDSDYSQVTLNSKEIYLKIA